MGSAGQLLAAALGQNDAQKRLRYYQTHLFALATEILGYDKLTEAFHKPMLDEQDRMRALRKLGRGKNTLWIWPRDHYKTTVRRAQVIQDLLIDPTDTMVWWHGVEDIAFESCEALSKILQHNKELRKLFPQGVLPSPSAKRFISKKNFRLRSAAISGPDTFSAFGSGSEATGAHGRHGYVDDVVTFNDIQDSQVENKKRWFGQTAMNVISTGGWFDGTGTRWDLEDMYSDWIKNRTWQTIVRSCYETVGKAGEMNYDGEPVLFSRETIERKRANMTDAEFAFQMMNDPSPSGEKPWDQLRCEHMIPAKDAMNCPFIVILHDPAPLNGEVFGEQKKRPDGEKDDWAIAVVGFRARGARQEIILLDGDISSKWTSDEGFERGAMLQKRWGTPFLAIEKTGQAVAFYTKEAQAANRRIGALHNPLDLTQTYAGKNAQFESLSSKAKRDEFLISEGCNAKFLEYFLSQARSWRPLPKGRNSLKHDDAANVASFATDPVFSEYAPLAMQRQDPSLDPDFADDEPRRSRYCAA